MVETRQLSSRFEELSAELLTMLGYKVEREARFDNSPIVDIIARRRKNILLVDVKVITVNPPALRDIRDAVSRSAAQLFSIDRDAKILVILSCPVEAEHLSWLSSEFALDIWDRSRIDSELSRHRSKSNDLHRRFEDFFRSLEDVERIGRVARQVDDELGYYTDSESARESALPELRDPAKLKGYALAKQLEAIPKGRAAAKLYESFIIEALNYLFEDYLVDARPQRRTEDDLDIMDIVYRVRPGHPFWDTLTRDFRARAIVFECKNYRGPIGPDQIYSTERYVNVGALRPVCFVISRKPPHKHAHLAAYGAMREGGKLFVLLEDNDIGQMLRIRDAQLAQGDDDGEYFDNDPTEVLDQRIYDFLSEMGR